MATNPYLRNPHLEGYAFFWKGGATGVLLVHGYTATTAEVRPLGRILHAQGYTVAGPLLPGHGTQPEEANRYTWRDWLGVVAEAYQQLAGQCTRVVVGGESTGSVLTLYLASQYAEIAGVLAYASALRLKMRPVDALRLRLMAPFVSAIEKAKPEGDDIWQGYQVYPLKGVVQLLRLQKATIRRLGLIRQPLLVVQGRLDPTVDPAVPQLLSGAVSSSLKEVHWMERSAHCVVLDCELERIGEITLRFLDRILNPP